MRQLFARTAAISVIAATGLFAACAWAEDAPVGNVDDGKRIFIADGCFMCHGRAGQGQGDAPGVVVTPAGPPRQAEQGGAGHQYPAPSEQVGEPSAEQQEPAVGDDVAAEHPLQVLHGEVQVAGDGRQRDVDDRGVEEVEEGDRAEEGEYQLAPAGGEEGRGCERWIRHE